MSTGEKFIEKLKEILEYPPYLIFVFVSSIFVFISLISKSNFELVWIFFLYSVVGSVWRYIEKDIDGGIKKYLENRNEQINLNDEKSKQECDRKHSIAHLIIIGIYHVGNVILFLALLRYLKIL